MLEILFLIRFVRRLSAIAKEKGRTGMWGGLGAVFWIGGEMIGFIVGAASSNDIGAGAYVIALLFAAAGATAAYFIVKSLKPLGDAFPAMAAMGGAPIAMPSEPPDLRNPYAPPRAQ
jgi:hypothetical protein